MSASPRASLSTPRRPRAGEAGHGRAAGPAATSRGWLVPAYVDLAHPARRWPPGRVGDPLPADAGGTVGAARRGRRRAVALARAGNAEAADRRRVAGSRTRSAPGA